MGFRRPMTVFADPRGAPVGNRLGKSATENGRELGATTGCPRGKEFGGRPSMGKGGCNGAEAKSPCWDCEFD